ncbi:MAG: isopenicillin synthase family oxygenase, partial [Rhizobacter sp.]|nr:isopenicillin synthase family oxygenase [Rhizobacter sp.]
PARASQPRPQPLGRSDDAVVKGEPATERAAPSADSSPMTDDPPADVASMPAAPPTLGAGVHTDYGNVTLLATDGVAGLQVRRRGGGWIDAPAVPGAFICNIGDCLMRWTNDVYVSTPHRVLQPVAERYSIALFVDPNPDARVAAIPSCVPAGEPPKYVPISAVDYLQSRFDSTYAPKPANGSGGSA